LIKVADWITPNWVEAAALSQLPVETLVQAEAAAHKLGEENPHLTIVVTGGDQQQTTDLVRLPTGQVHQLSGPRIDSNATHGTGCAFSSSLLCHLVAGADPIDAVRSAKEYVTEAIRRAPGLGQGKGPMNLLWPLGS
jgi:hydroxymethylpyrimidine/phosphomethylpyrimidine kinase